MLGTIEKVDVKPTSKPPGHWRCVYWVRPPNGLGPPLNPSDPPPIDLGDGHWISSPRHASEDLADAVGQRDNECNRMVGLCPLFVRYVRAEYFPDYPNA